MATNRTVFETRDYIFEVMTKISPSFAKRFPSKKEFNKIMEDPNKNLDLINRITEVGMSKSPKFAEKFRDSKAFAESMGVTTKYSGAQKEAIREASMTGLSKLYKGDFNNLLENRGKIQGMLQRARQDFASLGNVSTTEAVRLQSHITNLEKAVGIVEAVDAVQGARSDQDFTDIFNSESVPNFNDQDPSTWSASDKEAFDRLSPNEKALYTPTTGQPVANKFLAQVMPSVEYKVMELKGESPEVLEGFFPEATRRDRLGGDWVDVALGGAKDLFRMTGRALRPAIQEATGAGDPNLSYWEEFAKPDRYKTTSQEILDEVGGIQGVGGTIAKSAGVKLASALPSVASKLNKVAPFVNPAETIYGGLVKGGVPTSLKGKIGYNLAKSSPDVALDVGFEATRSEDEEGAPIASLLGGTLGGIASPLIREGSEVLRFSQENLRLSEMSYIRDHLLS
jgi:hypothetical protein